MNTKDFSSLLKEHPEALDSTSVLGSFLRDCYPNERGNINAILLAYNAGVFSMIEDGQLDDLLAAKIMTLLCEDCCMAKSNAEWVTKILCESYGVNILGKDNSISERNLDFIETKKEREDTEKKAITESAYTEVEPEDFEYVKNQDGRLVITKYKGFESVNIVIPSHIGNMPVGGIDRSAFKNFRTMETLRIEDPCETVAHSGITVIGAHAFERCPKLRKITFPSSLETIGDHAFSGCVSLQEIDFPDKLKTIDQCAFISCHNLKRVNLENTEVEELTSGSFWACNIQDLSLPKHLRIVRKGAFGGTDDVPFRPQKIVFPNGTKTLERGSCSFWYAQKPIDVYIPATITELDNSSIGCVRRVGSVSIGRCENVTIHCPPGSPAIELAHKWGYKLKRWDGTL